ncbi:GGDEF domain-containing protein [Spongiibacter taiwanensis]|uniref:GGDEF domain-containing protein n=1 Tax=Spongiibacter taiwanensis TaxID=1748242 RepID=UPI00203608F1|nr:GGDEF domain-containing protein [Spongiibacter taiwanensis]USA42214.1 GGDEF domain-containing protein [Spongiibacter taiwanensis]
MKPESLSSSQPDLDILARLHRFQRWALMLVVAVGAVVMFGWCLPDMASATLPSGWALMKFNTALALLLAALSLSLTQERRSARALRAGALSAMGVLVIAGSALLEHSLGAGLGIESLVVPDVGSSRPGLMSAQSASFLFLLGFPLLLGRARKSLWSRLADALSMALIIAAIIVFSGYCFGAAGLYGQSADTVTSPHTLLCMLLLTFVVVSRRAEYGIFSVLIGVGIGSRISRVAAPVALSLPIGLSYIFKIAASAQWVSQAYAAAMTTAFIALFFFWLVIVMAWRINDLEKELRDMSLSDELTGLYNRRGFYLLGEQALRDARRMAGQVSVLFFDLDNLKVTNDSLGHDVGNSLLKDMASLLERVCRANDIVARIGGDEYVVAMPCSLASSRGILQRLERACEQLNSQSGRPYALSYSVGVAEYQVGSKTTFQQLVREADELMYEQKQARKRARRQAMDTGTVTV